MNEGSVISKDNLKRKRTLRYLTISLIALVAFSLIAISASAAATGSFNIGGYWQPPTVGPAYPTDMNTNANWLAIKNANIDTLMGVEQGSAITKSMNENGINFSNANNVTLMATDGGIYGSESFTAADYTALDAKILPYKNDTRVKGLDLKDEPGGWNLEGFANTYKEAKSFAPNFAYYVNLLPFISEKSETDNLGSPACISRSLTMFSPFAWGTANYFFEHC